MKPPKTISEQIELLKSRNLAFGSVPTAERFLSNNNYYRVSGYWRKYQIDPNNGNDCFIDGTNFEGIVAIYELDALLRNLLQRGIGVFEICFRSKFAYCMAHSGQGGQLSYLQQGSYSNKFSKNEKFDDLLKKISDELCRSKERYVMRYKSRGEDIPIWAAIEVLSFGTVSKMYSRWLDKGVVKETVAQGAAFSAAPAACLASTA